MIVAIDGPAGAGKSSAAKALAERLGFRFLDTGAMYRAATLAVLRAGVDEADDAAVTACVAMQEIDVDGGVFLNGVDVSQEIRRREIGPKIYIVADNSDVRAMLTQAQRAFAERGDMVTEGRDQGTEVFPDAACKIYLTATPETRAKRRAVELAAAGQPVEEARLLQEIIERDQRDKSRSVGALRKADDAVEVWTDDLTSTEVVDALEAIAAARAE